MNFAEFVLLVQQMRKEQRKPSYRALTDWTDAELAVDNFIKQFNREFDELIRAEQAQLPTEFLPKVHTPPLTHPMDQEQP